MTMVEIRLEHEFQFSIDKVWALLGNFGDVEWGMPADKVELIGDGPGMIRRLYLPGADPVDERLDAIDHSAHTFSYSVLRGMPLPISGFRGWVEIKALSPSSSQVVWNAEGKPYAGTTVADAAAMLHGLYRQLFAAMSVELARRSGRLAGPGA